MQRKVLYLDFECGIKPSPRIVNGSQAVPYSIPWQVSLFRYLPNGDFEHNCGGTIISPRHVMTADHCLDASPYIYRIVVGLHSKNDTSGAVTHDICRYVKGGDHPRSDFSIVHLKKPIELGPRAIPACLPTVKMAGDFLANKTMTASGWGALQDDWMDGPFPNNLQFIKVQGVNNELCKERYSPAFHIRPDELCAGIGACYGDSGGKLLLE